MWEFGSALGSCSKENSSHGGGHTHTVGIHITSHELHRVVNRETGSHRTSGAVDVYVYVLVRILHLQVKHLGDDVVRERIADTLADEDDAVLHQAGDQIELDHGVPFLFNHADVLDRINDPLLQVGREKWGEFLYVV